MSQQINFLQGGTPVTRRVRTGLSDGQRTEVLEGLSGTETVIVGLSGAADEPSQRDARSAGPPVLARRGS